MVRVIIRRDIIGIQVQGIELRIPQSCLNEEKEQKNSTVIHLLGTCQAIWRKKSRLSFHNCDDHNVLSGIVIKNLSSIKWGNFDKSLSEKLTIFALATKLFFIRVVIS